MNAGIEGLLGFLGVPGAPDSRAAAGGELLSPALTPTYLMRTARANRQYIRELLFDVLDEREAAVILLVSGLGPEGSVMTHEEIQEELGLSEGQVRRAIDSGYKKLRAIPGFRDLLLRK